MLNIEEFTYLEEDDQYFAEAKLNGVEFAIAVDLNQFSVLILRSHEVSWSEMQKHVAPYTDYITAIVATYFAMY